MPLSHGAVWRASKARPRGLCPPGPPTKGAPLEPLRLRNDGRLRLITVPERPSFLSLKNGFLRRALGGGSRGQSPLALLTYYAKNRIVRLMSHFTRLV
jgi:hypothetical protein